MRIATFNVENLFSRAKVLNLQDNTRTGEILKKIGELEDELQKTVYDKPKILALYNETKLYIEIYEDRKKLFKRSGQAITGVAANGQKDWDGSIHFKRANFSEQARIATADTLKSLNADIQCMIEIEDRQALSAFDTNMMNKRFPYNMCIDGNDPRGIDVGVYSKFPIGTLRSNIFQKQGRSFIFSRDCLELSLELPNGKTLHFLANHFKSKLNNNPAADTRRKLQADTVRTILESRYNLATDLVVVAGDFNDTPDSLPMQNLLTTPNLTDVLELQFGSYRRNHPDRWTYKYGSQLNQIDFLLVSKPLKAAFTKAGVERRGMFGIPGNTPFPSVTSATDAASDHASVWAEFNL